MPVGRAIFGPAAFGWRAQVIDVRRALLLLLGLAATGLGCAGKQTPPDRITSPAEALFNGRTKSEVTCYKCHNGDGTGTLRGPDLSKRVPKLTNEQIVKAIMEGPGLMPSFKGKVTDAEALDLASWLHQRFPPQ